MRKKAFVFTRPPQRAKTRRSTGKAVASEEAYRTLCRTLSSEGCENAAGGLFPHPARTIPEDDVGGVLYSLPRMKQAGSIKL